MSCDEYCCNHGCNQGRNCPARKTPAAQRAIDEQSKTDRQEACCTGNCRQGRDCTEQSSSSWNLVDLVVIVAAIAIIGLVLAPYAAGYLSHMKG